MSCYRKGGCGPYEMYSCSECPASKPEYALKYEKEASNTNSKVTIIRDNLKDITLELCKTEIEMFSEFKKRLEEVDGENETEVVSVIKDFFIANNNITKRLSEIEEKAMKQ